MRQKPILFTLTENEWELNTDSLAVVSMPWLPLFFYLGRGNLVFLGGSCIIMGNGFIGLGGGASAPPLD